MNTCDLFIILAGQALTFTVVALVLYRNLKSKFERKINFVLAEFEKKPRRLGVQIFINTLPKVGSTSIFHMLKAALPEATIEHSHILSYEGQLAAGQDLKGIKENMGSPLKGALMKMIRNAMAARLYLDGLSANTNTDRIYFICGTREPLAWALSNLFELIGAGLLPDECKHPDNARRIIMDWFFERPVLHCLPMPREWLDREIKGYLGVDPLEGEFNHKAGYRIMDTKRGPLLLVRQESFGCVPQALADLLSVPSDMFKITRANIASDKKIGSHYQDVAKVLRFPKSFVEQVYSDPYAVTFYSAEERRAFTVRWSEE